MLKILIAEDDLMIADMIEEVLVEAGFDVCGIARTVAEGVALGNLHRPDYAVIDVRLADGGLGTEIAAQLCANGRLGVLYATGNVLMLTPEDGDACLVKPFRSVDLLRSLSIVADIVVTGKATPPFPAGFTLLKPPTAPQAPSHG